MDWAHHIKMDYAQNLKKDPVKAKKGPSQNFSSFRTSTIQGICSNLGPVSDRLLDRRPSTIEFGASPHQIQSSISNGR